jgi:hypothetical protein
VKKKKKKEEVQNIETDEEDNASKENGPASPAEGGGDEVNQELGGEEGEKQGEGEATPPKDPPTETEKLNKRNVSPQKPSARKKTCTSKPQLEATLTEDDIIIVRGAMEDVFEDLLKRYRAKQDELYGRIKNELSEVQKAIRSVCIVLIVPSASEIAEFGDEPSQL